MQESLIQLSCLKEACKRLGISYTELDLSGNLVRVETKQGAYHFANFATPFNTGSVEQVCKDKEFTYFLLKDSIRVPRTKGYFDPGYRKGYERYKKFVGSQGVVEDICVSFKLPVIVKKNSGSFGINVFLCNDKKEVQQAVEAVFSTRSPDYDYVVLAQEYIKPAKEYRAVFFNRNPILVYLKDISNARFVGNLSPLHYEGSKAIVVDDRSLIKSISRFVVPVFDKIAIEFVGYDLIQDERGKLWLIEMNSRPGFAHFIRDNGKERVISMYEKMLDFSG